MSAWCENCGGEWGVATEIVNGLALCEDCAICEELSEEDNVNTDREVI